MQATVARRGARSTESLEDIRAWGMLLEGQGAVQHTGYDGDWISDRGYSGCLRVVRLVIPIGL